MSIRFSLNTAVILAAGFLVVASRSFATNTVGWVGFGVSTGIAVLAVAALTVSAHRAPARGIGQGAMFLVALWSLIAALVFTGSTMTWLVFADAIGLAAVAVADLIAHELSTERVVHTIEVREPRAATHTV